jgi:hypothetical protein
MTIFQSSYNTATALRVTTHNAMKEARYYDPGDVRIEQVEEPVCSAQPGED